MCKHEKHVGLKLISLRLTSQNFPCKHAFSINPRPLSALELTLSGLIMGSRVDTAGDNHSPNVIISYFLTGFQHQNIQDGIQDDHYIIRQSPFLRT